MAPKCDICFVNFDLDSHRPKVLPCGHTICKKCLLNPALERMCPTCRKELAATPDEYPDNIFVIRLAADEAPPCKKAKTEETEVQQLQLGVEAGRKVVEVLRLVVPRAVEAVNRQLESSVAQLCQLEKALEKHVKQETAEEVGSAPDIAVQLQLAVQLQHSLRLLATHKCSVVAEQEDGSIAKADVPHGESSDIFRLLLLQLNANDQLEKVDHGPVPAAPPGYVGPPMISILSIADDDLDNGLVKVNNILRNTQRSRNIRSLQNLKGDGSEELLRVVAPHLEELQILGTVQPGVMVEVGKMPSLKRLDVECDKSLDYPDLPLQLEELSINRPSEKHMRFLERMPQLRSLRLRNYLGPNLTFPDSQHRALLWLRVSLNVQRKPTMLSLIRANASSLQDLQIYCTISDPDFFFPDLGQDLAACGLLALRRLVLVRPSNEPCTERVAGCLLQRRAYRSFLSSSVEVLCYDCNNSVL